MQQGSARTLDEGERRRMAAMMLASARGGSPGGRSSQYSPPRQGYRGETRSRVRVRRRQPRTDLARRLVPLLLELPGRLGFRRAFCAAVAAWSIALVFSLGCFEVVRW